MLGGDEGAIEAFIEETKANRLAVKAVSIFHFYSREKLLMILLARGTL